MGGGQREPSPGWVYTEGKLAVRLWERGQKQLCLALCSTFPGVILFGCHKPPPEGEQGSSLIFFTNEGIRRGEVIPKVTQPVDRTGVWSPDLQTPSSVLRHDHIQHVSYLWASGKAEQ